MSIQGQKVAVITGASQGLGAGIVAAYRKLGYSVVATSRSPGIIKTPMHPEAHHEMLGGLHPVGHMGEVSDIANAVIYLENAPFVTGEILHVDGGQSAGH
jgi:NAD(P)-dependent dehydrogenase (short-subunit alcohol dehydrogenase family)